MTLSCIVAMSQNRVIGKNNQIPWQLSEDLQHFKKTTWGHSIIMGRKTYESIGKALPGRKNIILTRNQEYSAEDIEIWHDISKIQSLSNHSEEFFIIGGQELYQSTLDWIDHFYITEVLKNFQGDAFFPEYDFDPQIWQSKSTEIYYSQKENLPYRYLEYTK